MFRNIVLFPHRLGQPLLGVNETPSILRSFLETRNKFHPVKCGNSNKQNLQNLYDVMCKINNNKLIVGGDHSMSIATLSNTLQKDPNTKVLWIDAHADINTPESSPSGNLHGMSLSFITGLASKKYVNQFPFIKKILPFENLMYIGLRDIDSFEKEVLHYYDIANIPIWEMEYRPQETVKKIEKFIGTNSVHVSFDVDVIEPDFMPCTGTRVKRGLSIESTKQLFDMLKYKSIVNMDLTELNLSMCSRDDKMTSLRSLFYILDDYLV